MFSDRLARAQGDLARETSNAILATEREVKAALRLLCLSALDSLPSAKYVLITNSDQGDWMISCGIYEEWMGEEFGFDEADDAPAHLYWSHESLWGNYCRPFEDPAYPGATRNQASRSAYRNDYWVDINLVISKLESA